MEKGTAFFMVYVDGEKDPSFRHSTNSSATTEAERLAEKTGKKVWVLGTIKSIEMVKFNTKDCRPEHEELPF